MLTELIRIPSRRYAKARPDYRASMKRYDYVTEDGRWYVEQNRGCGGGWTVIDTTGQYVCSTCYLNNDGHIAIVRTLYGAKAYITELSI